MSSLPRHVKVQYYENAFSLVPTYINWSSLSLPTPRMRKANKSCIVSAAHPLVKRGSYGLFRFSSCCYITTEEIFIDWPPLRGRECPPSNHTGPSNCIRATGRCRHVLIVFTVAEELKAPTHCQDSNQQPTAFIRPLYCLSSDPFGRKVALNTPLQHTAYSTVACTFCACAKYNNWVDLVL